VSTPRVAPIPSPALTSRVGWLYQGPDGPRLFDQLGLDSRQEIIGLLGEQWDFRGKRVLDFGCGAGRILRHFLDEAEHGQFWGCDIDAASIDWMQANLVPPLNVFQCGEHPPLALADGSLDLVWAASVFTHLGSSWSAWMLELRRILAPGGLLLASFIGEGTSVSEAADWDEDRIGMNVIDGELPYAHGGAIVLHSRWWIRAHWGRAFEILSLDRARPGSQGWAVMRKREQPLTTAQLEAPEPGEPRELESLRHNVEQLAGRHSKLYFEHLQTLRALEEIRGSRSWKLTAPLRGINQQLARARGSRGGG
jgi:SAM-dependent methyltransferase